MDFSEYRRIVSEQTSNNVYFANPETYELVYMNRVLKDVYHIKDDAEYIGQKCYKLLQCKDAPCEFCPHKYLSEDATYTWYHFNEYLGKYLKNNDKLVHTEDGRLLHMEISVDITEHEDAKKELGLRAESENTLVKCIRTLISTPDLNQATNQLLANIGQFYHGERAYIFEFNYDTHTLSNTYEWCGEGVSQELHNLQNIDLDVISHWIEAFYEKGSFAITSVGRNLNKESMEYKLLKAQNIESLIAAPLMDNGKIVGFIGVDDPRRYAFHFELLVSVAYFILNDIQKRKMMSELERLSYVDLLTGVYNRNKYIHDLEQWEHQLAKHAGVVYLDINGLKELNDQKGHQAGDELIKQIALEMSQCFPQQVYRIGGDEFIAICTRIEREDFEEQVESLKRRLVFNGEIRAAVGSVWNKDGATVSQVIEIADKEMYEDKSAYYVKNVGVGI